MVAESRPWQWIDDLRAEDRGVGIAESRGPFGDSIVAWTPSRPLGMRFRHDAVGGADVTAHVALVPRNSVWSDLLLDGSDAGGSNSGLTDGDWALFAPEASLELGLELGARREHPWRIALGGGWTQGEAAFAAALEDSFERGGPRSGDDEGEALIWFRVSREF